MVITSIIFQCLPFMKSILMILSFVQVASKRQSSSITNARGSIVERLYCSTSRFTCLRTVFCLFRMFSTMAVLYSS